MDNQKCWFLTVEPGSDFDKLFQEWLENFHLKNFIGKKVIEGFISCDSSDDYFLLDDEKDLSVPAVKAKIFEARIGLLLITLHSFDHLFLISCDGTFWQKLCAIGLGGVWDGQYFSFPSHQAFIHFCFLNGFFDFLDSHLYEFKHQLERARARMRTPPPSFSLGDFKPVELSDEEYDAIPF